MSLIQLRIHGGVDALGDELTGAILKVLLPVLKKGSRGKAIAQAYRKEFGEALQRRLVASEHCGNLAWCTEELEEVSGGDQRLAVPGMRVFLLADRAALEKLVTSLGAASYRLLVRSVEKEEAREIPYKKVADAVERELLRHAFDSQRCGEEWLCKENLASRGMCV